MTTTEIIQYIRLSTGIPNEGGAVLSMTDEEILLYLNVVLTRDFSDVPSLEYLPASGLYPLTLLCKKELYWALAVRVSSKYDLGADNNNYLKRSQMFDHYKDLAEQASKEYQDYLDSGGGLSEDGVGANTLSSFDVLLPNRYYTGRYYNKGKAPAPVLYLDSVSEESAELHWKNGARKFAWCNVYLSENRIVDMYQIGTNKIVDKSTIVHHFIDSRQNTLRLEGLKPNTDYYVAIEVVDLSSLIGYSEVNFTTEEIEVSS